MSNGGTIGGLFRKIEFKKHFVNLDWSVQWNFVFKKTIPFFWIPAHTFTFMLPPDYRVLFAALLGIALGVILSLAALKSSK
jgi:Na+-transporting NADH:ubiquinone oxidoreductase subunit NqrB